jgi:hypothetical protein
MKIFKAKYKGRDKILNFSTTSTKAAYNAFLKQGEPQEIEVEVFDGESWTTFDEHIKNRSSIMNERPSSIESEVASQKGDWERIESKHDKNEIPLSIESALAQQEEFLSKAKSENSASGLSTFIEKVGLGDEKSPTFSQRENVFYIFEHPLKPIEVVNTSNFSWLGFFFSLFYQLYHKSWKNSGSQDWLLGTIFAGLVAGWAEYSETGISFAIWIGIYIGNGYVGGRVKAKSLMRKGYTISDKIKAESKDMALAEFSKRNQSPSVDNRDIKNEIKSSGLEDSKLISSVAEEIESFANLRDKGIITPDEFEQKKKQLLNL